MIKQALVLAAVMMGCDTESVEDTGPTEDTFDVAAELAVWLSGSFDSSEQAAADYSYYAVQLVACPVEAPELGEHVLYIEQALSDTPQEPYRQRLYVIEPLEDNKDGAPQARSSIYTIDNEDDFVGLCDDAEIASFSADQAELREGCEVDLTWDGSQFSGQTQAETCSSTLNGATWASSVVTVQDDRIISWDQGWDDDGNQIWGATAGGYIFLRQD
ncbi:MAG: chromophore lyase CpcT/CpeT [Myxococcota bacterium]|nr:chromophore lyase CpcT/CpeT [Myxococcota bacterium]